MWPFSKRRPRVEREELPKQPESAFEYKGFETNDASLKLWMPEKMIAALDRLSVEHDVSRPDILRWIFFDHVYGRDLFAGLLDHSRIKFSRNAVPMFCRKRNEEAEVPETLPTARSVDLEYLGKSTEDFKLWLPTRLKVALQELADNYQRPLSDYLRTVLARHLLVRSFIWSGNRRSRKLTGKPGNMRPMSQKTPGPAPSVAGFCPIFCVGPVMTGAY